MTVKQLIELLSEYNPDLVVKYNDTAFDLCDIATLQLSKCKKCLIFEDIERVLN